jgi:hypothetical protein
LLKFEVQPLPPAANDALQPQPADTEQSRIQNPLHTHMELDDDLSLAARRPRRQNRQLLKRFQDILPVPLPAPPPPAAILVDPLSDLEPSSPNVSALRSPSSIPSLASRIGRMFQTPRNIFGLFRQYCSDKPPSHDPEENINLTDYSDYLTRVGDASQLGGSKSDFSPFPNENSFLLGEWYWNHGVQKSRESFSELLSIIGSPDFRPEDVRHTKWRKIDAALARNDFDKSGDGSDIMDDDADAEWMDEDAGWKKTPVYISVPFHSRLKNPGPKEYLVGDFHHRSFVSVIRERVTNLHNDQNFHYEPFKLFWKPTDESAETRVHGELYTSPAFLEAHRDLQDSPQEPGCDLPRVVVAMMFWSDNTHLTSFGNAKLWPNYLFFGNHSKYNRCKPRCHLCNHVAYFLAVGPFSLFNLAPPSLMLAVASRRIQRLCR